MTFLRILALVFVAGLAVDALISLFGEAATTGFLWAVLIYVTGRILVELWRKRA